MFGFLVLDKPIGPTSRDVVNKVQRLLRPLKVGHAGTLDPLASGVLVIGVGSATRLVEYVHRYSKRYEATFLLGTSSDTEDISGQLVEHPDAARPTHAEVVELLPAFRGDLMQVPPAFSALKVAGRRAYSMARAGEQVELAARPIKIHTLELLEYEYPVLRLAIVCSSGTYVRSLGRDMAQALGTEAVMTALRRTSIGPFTLAQAVAPGTPSLDDLRLEQLSARLLNPLRALQELEHIVMPDDLVARLRHGQTIPVAIEPSETRQEVIAVDGQRRLLAILGPREPGFWKPSIVFPVDGQALYYEA